MLLLLWEFKIVMDFFSFINEYPTLSYVFIGFTLRILKPSWVSSIQSLAVLPLSETNYGWIISSVKCFFYVCVVIWFVYQTVHNYCD